MSQQIVSSNGIHLAGDFQGWNPGANAMIDMGNGIYSITLDLPPGTYYFKFINGNTWGEDEIVPSTCGIDDGSSNFNREINVAGTPILLPAICFGECSTCTTGTYTTTGSALFLGGQCHEITQSAAWLSGAIWSNTEIDLNISFTLQFKLNFGSDNVGADGMAFVLQRSGNGVLGNNGGGLGYMGISPSLAVEFDTFENPENGDPVYDHVAIQKMGDVSHTGINSLAAPVQMSSLSANVEDGADHIIELRWNTTSQILEVYFDCVFRQQVQYDFINQIFGGESLVFWGITGGTGSDFNIQTACIQPDALITESLNICPGSYVMLHAGASANGIYAWTPDLYLDDATLANPIALPPDSMVYSVTVTDLCNQSVVRTVTIFVLENNPACAILPFRLISFDGKRNNGLIEFNWKAETDAMHESFVVQKSTNGFEFTDYLVDYSPSPYPLQSEIEAEGNDDFPSLYFRLLETDIHGRRNVVSPLLFINVNVTPGWLNYDPVLHVIRINNATPQLLNLRIFTIQGQTIIETNIPPDSGIQRVPMPELSSGVYIAAAHSNHAEMIQIFRFVIQ